MFQGIGRFGLPRRKSANFCAARPPSPRRLLHIQRNAVGDHSDKLGIGGFAFGIGNRVPEVLLQSLQIAPVPGHLDGVANLLPCSLA